MTSPPNDHHIDCAALQFPSDRITLADFRRAHPARFAASDGECFDNISNDETFTLEVAFFLERLLARAAFAAARGDTVDVLAHEGFERAECVEELAGYYARYGVVTGQHQTEQLVRDLESQAAAQAAGPRR